MFEIVLSPIINAVKSWMSEKTYMAAKEGASLGLKRFADEFRDFAEGIEALPVASVKQLATQPSAAQMTTAPDDRSEKVELARRLSAEGKSQRAIADELGVAQSTVNGWLKSN